jgi:hypothetical protein
MQRVTAKVSAKLETMADLVGTRRVGAADVAAMCGADSALRTLGGDRLEVVGRVMHAGASRAVLGVLPAGAGAVLDTPRSVAPGIRSLDGGALCALPASGSLVRTEEDESIFAAGARADAGLRRAEDQVPVAAAAAAARVAPSPPFMFLSEVAEAPRAVVDASVVQRAVAESLRAHGATVDDSRAGEIDAVWVESLACSSLVLSEPTLMSVRLYQLAEGSAVPGDRSGRRSSARAVAGQVVVEGLRLSGDRRTYYDAWNVVQQSVQAARALAPEETGARAVPRGFLGLDPAVLRSAPAASADDDDAWAEQLGRQLDSRDVREAAEAAAHVALEAEAPAPTPGTAAAAARKEVGTTATSWMTPELVDKIAYKALATDVPMAVSMPAMAALARCTHAGALPALPDKVMKQLATIVLATARFDRAPDAAATATATAATSLVARAALASPFSRRLEHEIVADHILHFDLAMERRALHRHWSRDALRTLRNLAGTHHHVLDANPFLRSAVAAALDGAPL